MDVKSPLPTELVARVTVVSIERLWLSGPHRCIVTMVQQVASKCYYRSQKLWQLLETQTGYCHPFWGYLNRQTGVNMNCIQRTFPSTHSGMVTMKVMQLSVETVTYSARNDCNWLVKAPQSKINTLPTCDICQNCQILGLETPTYTCCPCL